MTMSRKTKRVHQETLSSGDFPKFQSPTLIARLGRKVMNREDYTTERMGRRVGGSQPAGAIRERNTATKINHQRRAGRTRTDFV